MTNDPETIAKLLETMIETQERSKREAHLADLTARISVLEKTTAKKDSLDKLENRLMRWMLGTAFGLVTATLAVIALVFNFCNTPSGN